MADGSAAGARSAMGDARRPSRPISTYLFVLALVALLPAFVFSAILLQRNNEAQQQVVVSLVNATTRAMAGSVERQIEGLETTLRVLATDRTLGVNRAAFYDRAVAALGGSGAYLIALDGSFNQLLNTRVPFGSTLGQTSDPDSARRAIETGRVTVSEMFFGRTAQQWVFNVLLPLPEPLGNTIILALTQNASALGEALTSRPLPPGWHVALVDGTGKLMVATPGVTVAPGEPLGIPLQQSSTTSGWVDTTRDGTAIRATFAPVAGSSWQVVTWGEMGLVGQPVAETFWMLLAGGVVLAAMVVLVVYWVSLQIGRSVHGLEADAKRLGSGQPVEARHFPIREIGTVSEALGEASRRRQAAEREVRFLMRELAHRSKNQMTVIAAMAKQTARGADSVPEFVSSFEKRIFGLARSTDLLLANGVAGVDLRELIQSQIAPFCPVDGERCRLEGGAIRINAQAAQIIGMAAHELATNAVKYGAFSNETGRLAVSWKRDGGVIEIVWSETGPGPGPEIHRRGFGTTVLENMVGRSLGAEVTRETHPGGLTWRFRIPIEAVDPSGTLNAHDDPRKDDGLGQAEEK